MIITKILIINGPNLNLLGTREKSVYGNQDFESYLVTLRANFINCDISYFQTNHEGAIIDKIQEAGGENYIILNAGAYTHTSIAIADAITSVKANLIEVHISNVYQREQYRHHSYISFPAQYAVVGKGLQGYDEAIQFIISSPDTKTIRATIKGKVQGVWFRYQTQKEAEKLKIKGYVTNQPNGSVYVEATGAKPNIETFIQYLHVGPEHAKVQEVIIEELSEFDDKDFVIKR